MTISHTYKKAGIYQVNVKVSDVNGVSAFLQVVAVASGKVDAVATPKKKEEAAKRAKSTQAYILSKGITADRIESAVGFGESRLIIFYVGACVEIGRVKN